MNEPIQFNKYILSDLIAENVEIKKKMWQVEKEKEILKNQVEEQYKLIEMLKNLLKGDSNEQRRIGCTIQRYIQKDSRR